MAKSEEEWIEIGNHRVRVSNPAKPYFSRGVQLSKLDIVSYYLSIADGALNGIRNRPVVLKRFVDGAEKEPFYQKRAPSDLPEWMRTVTLSFPSGRTAEEVVVDDAAGLAWIVNLGCIELHPHAVTADNLDHPNELRIDLDPQPGVGWDQVRSVAMEVKALLDEAGLVGWPKTSGSRGIHVNVRIQPQWDFTEVRRAALALARAVERRHPQASSKWWKEERHGVFLDYNQNAKDRTTCSAYSVRPLPDARVSTPLAWDEVMQCDPADFTVLTVPARFANLGDPYAAMDDHAGTLEALLEMASRDEANGIGDAPWPPHFKKQWNEGKRVQPSKAKKPMKAEGEDTDPNANESDTENADDENTDPDDNDGVTAKAGGEDTDPNINDGDAAKAGNALSAKGATLYQPGPKAQVKNAKRRQGPKARSIDAPPKASATGRRKSTMPLVVVAQSPDKAAAESGLDRWKQQHAEAAGYLALDDILTDRMRGSAYVWYRIRVNLRNVPENLRPAQGTPDPDDDPTRAWREAEEETA